MSTISEAEQMDGPLPSNLVEMWNKFLLVPADRSFLGVTSDHLFKTDLFPLQRKRELALMLQLAKRINPKTVMEIGADKGGTLYHWCEYLEPKTVIACEIRGTPYWNTFEDRFPDIDFLWLSCSSFGDCSPGKSTSEYVRQWLEDGDKSKIDVLFIDGDKSFFLADFNAYKNLMAPTGIVFMHDITDAIPGSAYRAIQRGEVGDYRTLDLINTSESVEMRLFGREPKCGHDGWLRHWAGRSCGIGCVLMPECKI
jgi:hypothetical protein